MKRRHFLLAILAVASSARAANAEARRFRVAFANLNEEPGTPIEGLGFSGAEIRRSFELASRSLPLGAIRTRRIGDCGPFRIYFDSWQTQHSRRQLVHPSPASSRRC